MMRRFVSAFLALAVAAVLVIAGLAEPSLQPRPAEASSPPVFLQVEPAHPGFTPALDGSEPIYFLVLGDNYRKGIEESHLSDSIHVVGLNPARAAASIVGIPRDSWVTIPGHGQAKINEAYHYGGCKMAVATVEGLSGLTMDYCVVTGFSGFKAMITEMGGVLVNVPYDIQDSHVKFSFKKGRMLMTGKQALEFARARYGVPNGDFSRTENQGLILVSLLAQLNKQSRSDPSELFRYLAATMRNVDVGELGPDELINLGFTAQGISSKKVKNLACPGGIGTKDGQSIVILNCSKIFKKMKNDGLA